MPKPANEGRRIYPVILSGGSGTRLWPLSRKAHPKQLLHLDSGHTLLQKTALRVANPMFEAPTLVCNEEHRFIIAEQLREAGIEARAILVEPVGRDSAPAVAAAAHHLADADPDALMLVQASDHLVADRAAFLDAVRTAAVAAASGALVTFGIPARRPETGFGYIRQGAPLIGIDGCFAVESFVEKPDPATAEAYVADGGYAWNSGMFLFGAARFLDELAQFEPDMAAGCRAAVDGAAADLDFVRLEAGAFSACRKVSVDFAVMEHTGAAAVVPAEIGWSDLGSWVALWETGEKSGDSNVTYGDVLTRNVKNSYIHSEGVMTAVLGLDDVVVVAADDVVLVATRDAAQGVRQLVDDLEKEGRTEHLFHPTVHRPWGQQRAIDRGNGFQVRRVTIKPGGSLSLQKHRHRAEHWVVLSGTARVTRGGETFEVRENESTFIPRGAVHRLENPGDEPLHLIEVQSGDVLDEDDVERLDDAYGRA